MLDKGLNPNTHKLCRCCKQAKLLNDFYNSTKNLTGKGVYCKLCDNKQRKLRFKYDPVKRRKKYLKNKDLMRSWPSE